MDTLETPPLVLIEWVDSGQPMSAWQWLHQIGNHLPHRCVSVGFLVQDDANAKVLAPNLGASDGSGDFDQASGLTTIPTAAVQRMVKLSANGASACSPASPSLPSHDRDAGSARMRQAS
jgi:hypothetical protein